MQELIKNLKSEFKILLEQTPKVGYVNQLAEVSPKCMGSKKQE